MSQADDGFERDWRGQEGDSEVGGETELEKEAKEWVKKGDTGAYTNTSAVVNDD